MRRGEIIQMDAYVPHIMVPEEDCLTFEWWDGDFIAKDCVELFDEYTAGRIGPDKLKKK